MTPLAQRLQTDPTAWDAFVEASPTGAYPQLTAWARVKAANGWGAERIAVDGGSGPTGVQLLVRDLRPLPWRVGYAPRGPVSGVDAAADIDADAIAALTDAIRAAARRHRLAEIAIDPEVEADHPMIAHLDAAGWQPTPSIQADRTRLVDLTQDEEALWAGLRPKWRQYVSKARRAGVTIEDAGAAGLDDFYRIYVETARRAGFVHRAQRAYDAVFCAYDVGGRVRLLLARLADGTPSAALLLLRCGVKVIEPYGGMTDAGAASRANYLLKWEAIRSSREQGAEVYDMWGVAHPGIERFKSGFGGREVRYTGGWVLVVSRVGHEAIRLARRAAVAVARLRHGTGSAATADADAT